MDCDEKNLLGLIFSRVCNDATEVEENRERRDEGRRQKRKLGMRVKKTDIKREGK